MPNAIQTLLLLIYFITSKRLKSIKVSLRLFSQKSASGGQTKFSEGMAGSQLFTSNVEQSHSIPDRME